ncbi:hypothetical protein HK405_012161, partial [Cladochytrium tenue]
MTLDDVYDRFERAGLNPELELEGRLFKTGSKPRTNANSKRPRSGTAHDADRLPAPIPKSSSTDVAEFMKRRALEAARKRKTEEEERQKSKKDKDDRLASLVDFRRKQRENTLRRSKSPQRPTFDNYDSHEAHGSGLKTHFRGPELQTGATVSYFYDDVEKRSSSVLSTTGSIEARDELLNDNGYAAAFSRHGDHAEAPIRPGSAIREDIGRLEISRQGAVELDQRVRLDMPAFGQGRLPRSPIGMGRPPRSPPIVTRENFELFLMEVASKTSRVFETSRPGAIQPDSADFQSTR